MTGHAPVALTFARTIHRTKSICPITHIKTNGTIMNLAAMYWIVVDKYSSETASFAKRHSPEEHCEHAENHKCEESQGNMEVFMF